MEKGKGKIPVECWTRVVGYLSPLHRWNKAKQLEFEERQVYDVKEYRNKEESMRQPSTPA